MISVSKFAIFVSGPIRFADLVRRNLDARLQGVPHDFFYHLWQQDLSNKVREGYQSDSSTLLGLVSTKALIVHQSYSQDFFKDSIGTQVNTHSSVNAVVGMFLGIGQLCSMFRLLPDRTSYTHILRIRTDCAILSPDFLSMLPLGGETVMLGQDNGLPPGWVSDHLLFTTAELFLKIYDFKSVEDIYNAFKKGNRNPEKTLKYLLDSQLPIGTKLVTTATRFRDYQIVYLPAREGDQPWVVELLRQGRVEDLFLNPEKHMVADQNIALLAEGLQVAPRSDPYRYHWLSVLRRWIRFLRS